VTRHAGGEGGGGRVVLRQRVSGSDGRFTRSFHASRGRGPRRFSPGAPVAGRGADHRVSPSSRRCSRRRSPWPWRRSRRCSSLHPGGADRPAGGRQRLRFGAGKRCNRWHASGPPTPAEPSIFRANCTSCTAHGVQTQAGRHGALEMDARGTTVATSAIAGPEGARRLRAARSPACSPRSGGSSGGGRGAPVGQRLDAGPRLPARHSRPSAPVRAARGIEHVERLGLLLVIRDDLVAMRRCSSAPPRHPWR
jgi:hypothetical protein